MAVKLSLPKPMAVKLSLLNDIIFELREDPMSIEGYLGWLHFL